MKKNFFLIILLFTLHSFCQTTFVPDDNFEQELINLGYDNVLDDYVLTSNIVNITTLQLEDLDIYDLTGIEGFASLESLDLSRNFLTTIDISHNLNLDHLDCAQINTLIELNIQNGNNTNFLLGASNCPNLVCVQVDDIDYVNANINSTFFFNGTNNYILSLDCSTLAIDDIGKENIVIYPNPSNDFICINGIHQIKQYKIYNSLGLVVKTGFLNDEQKIDVRNLITGLYYLKFDNTTTIKFLKK